MHGFTLIDKSVMRLRARRVFAQAAQVEGNECGVRFTVAGLLCALEAGGIGG